MKILSDILKGPDGTLSNSRLIADVMIVCGLIMAFLFVLLAVNRPTVDLMKLATAIGVVFSSLAGTALGFLFLQKRTESKTDQK
jgi:small-conductance mechanosensitive channel